MEKRFAELNRFLPIMDGHMMCEYDGDQVLVAMEMTPSGEHETISVSLPDYSYTLPTTAG